MPDTYFLCRAFAIVLCGKGGLLKHTEITLISIMFYAIPDVLGAHAEPLKAVGSTKQGR